MIAPSRRLIASLRPRRSPRSGACSSPRPAALAENGVGLAGPTTDKTVTFFCFGVIAFFALLPIVLSLIQGAREAQRTAHETLTG